MHLPRRKALLIGIHHSVVVAFIYHSVHTAITRIANTCSVVVHDVKNHMASVVAASGPMMAAAAAFGLVSCSHR